jgi:UDP-N-acetylmuramyl pentapeptide synthase
MEELKKNPIEDSLVLLKGSRGMKLEGLMELL